jgi:hypothetical protein
MVAYVRLPGRGAPYKGALGTVIDEATWFILRGIGLSDRAIARAFVPGKFAANTL